MTITGGRSLTEPADELGKRRIGDVAGFSSAILTTFCATLLVMTFGGCSAFKLKAYENFGDWYIGKVGFANACDPCSGNEYYYEGIVGDRTSWLGHFRSLELIWQPAGGWKYPPCRSADTRVISVQKSGNITTIKYRIVGYTTSSRGDTPQLFNLHSLTYFWTEPGLVEVVIPYKIVTANDATVLGTIGYFIFEPFLYVTGLLVRVPAYAIHDTLKTTMIPVAAVYYWSHDPRDSSSADGHSTEIQSARFYVAGEFHKNKQYDEAIIAYNEFIADPTNKDCFLLLRRYCQMLCMRMSASAPSEQAA